MILKATIFRLTKFAYKTATKKRLNLFINLIISISFFAVFAASLSLYFENKIEKLDLKIITKEVQKINLENQISAVPNSINLIRLVKDFHHSTESNIDLLSDLNPGGVMLDSFVSHRDMAFQKYYQLVTSADISIKEVQYYINLNKIIFKNDTKILKNILKFENINNKNKNDLKKVTEKAAETEKNYLKIEEDNLYTGNGRVGVYLDVIPEGLLINEIDADSPAFKSGLKVGDIILSVNGKSFKNLNDLSEVEFNIKPDMPANFKVASENLIKNITVVPEKQINPKIYELKDTHYYLKFYEYLNTINIVLNDQQTILLDFGLNFAVNNIELLNHEIHTINESIESLSEKESASILFAFIIQLIIFFSSQYFELSLVHPNEKRKNKK